MCLRQEDGESEVSLSAIDRFRSSETLEMGRKKKNSPGAGNVSEIGSVLV